MVSRYKKRAQTKRLCDGETRLAPGSENESTDVLFEKTEENAFAPSSSFFTKFKVLLRVFPFERRRDFKGRRRTEKDARKEDRLSLSLFAEKPKALSFIPSCQNVRTVASLETRWPTLCKSARNI